MTIGALSFTTPWILAALLALPAIWFLLRALPPPPRRMLFPPLRLLFGLEQDQETPARTPWWLLALRMAIAGLVILALAGPVWRATALDEGQGPVALIVDNGWTSAADWEARATAVADTIAAADRANRSVIVIPTAPSMPPAAPALSAPEAAREEAAALAPYPWAPDRIRALALLEQALSEAETRSDPSIVWIADGLEDPAAAESGLSAAAFSEALAELGRLDVIAPRSPDVLALSEVADGPAGLTVALTRPAWAADSARSLTLQATDSAGQVLGLSPVVFGPGITRAQGVFDLPLALRNRITRIEAMGASGAATVRLIADDQRRRAVGVVSATGQGSDQPLLSDTYYVTKALQPFSEVIRGTAEDLLNRDVAILTLADTGRLVGANRQAIESWVEGGGVLLRFAGPRMAAQADSLLPVRLRFGGRNLGGAMAWNDPQPLAPFARGSPFYGLEIPAADIEVRQQVLAQPSIDLSDKTWARLADGTPLVTAERRGSGWVVLFHVTANLDWSDLPASGLYVEMLRRLTGLAGRSSGSPAAMGEAALPPRFVLDGFGQMQTPPPHAKPLRADAALTPGPEHPPGLYGRAGGTRALNLLVDTAALNRITRYPGADSVRFGLESGAKDLASLGYGLALGLALIDGLIALIFAGALALPQRRPAGRATAGMALLALAVTAAAAGFAPRPALAQDNIDIAALEAATRTRLAYVRTGIPDSDEISRQGLEGLSRILYRRTTFEPAEPKGVDLETDELSFYPLLYWRVTPGHPDLPPEALEQVDAYMRNGGMILFDTADRAESFGGPDGEGPGARRLKELLSGLDAPPLAPIPPDHVLTKSFYLLQDFPGRWSGGQVWAEAPRTADEGPSARDGVSPLVIGSHDWAGAWAIDAQDQWVLPVPGTNRQREMAFRFGVNLVMYALTGNYKADLVHIPYILERLDQ